MHGSEPLPFYPEDSGQAPISTEFAVAALRRYRQGEGVAKIARDLGYSETDVRAGITWALRVGIHEDPAKTVKDRGHVPAASRHFDDWLAAQGLPQTGRRGQ